ncbi:MAG: response regulator, partial [Polyangiaceae bacterium]|nr:response regulator [Polyangiaceae bacterium]
VDAQAVTNGTDALKALRNEEFDVVLLDVKMPGVGGLDVMKMIRAANRRVQVILITGHGSAEDGAEGMGAGAFDYVMKPININDLLQRLQAAGRVARNLVG